MVVAAMLMLAAALFAQAEDPANGEPLEMAMSGAFQPFSTTDAEGNLVGFDADIAKEVAERIGREPELVQTDWAAIQAGLQGRKYDLICGSMAITEERLETMHFSLPYYVSGAQVYIKRGLDSLEGLRMGVTEDSTYAAYIDENPDEFPGVEVVQYGSEAEIVAAMNTDKIDAFVSDRIVGGFYVQQGGGDDIVPFGDLLYQESCGIAARKESAELIRQVNDALFEMIQDGTYAEIYRKWVGTDPDIETLLAGWSEFSSIIPRDEDGEAATAAGETEEDEDQFIGSVSEMLPLLARGAWLTIQLSLITAVLALVLGAVVGIGSVSRSGLVRGIVSVFVWVTRGTPLLVQLFISYFAIATVVNRFAGAEIIGAFGAALIALVVNTTAYNAETIRGGINAVGKGQWDAAATLGMPRQKLLQRIILPQAFRDSLPSLGNNLVVLIKDTSLVGAITLIELTYSARNIVFQTGNAFTPFVVAALFYLVIISLVSLGVKSWEKHLSKSRISGGQAA
jgi:His/Glu/Gln/Arg/opine family amino acid ABC transporter permease subunit